MYMHVGSRNFKKMALLNKLCCNFEKRLIQVHASNGQTVGAKVHCREGNNPDCRLKLLSAAKLKVISYIPLGGRLGSSHPIMKA